MCCLFLSVTSAHATIKVAVASNFTKAAQELATAFADLGYNKPILLFGSTGKHTAQIMRGLEVDVLMAADRARPMLLEQRGFTVNGSRTNYALGRLMVWLNEAKSTPISGVHMVAEMLSQSERIAIANPKLAPYGEAAQQVILSLGIEKAISAHIVMGENVAQAYQFVRTGNADAGLIARSMIGESDVMQTWLVPTDLHAPIEQQMILINDVKEAQRFYDFVKSDQGRAIILKHGYDVPND